MPLDVTLQKVDADIRAGDLGKAISRLRGLIGSYPQNIELRKRLGDVYWEFHRPAMAGRYWYLVENKDEQMTAACRQFENECHNDPLSILVALKFKGDTASIRETHAGRILYSLLERAKEKYPGMSGSLRIDWSKPIRMKGRQRPSDLLVRLGCIALAVAFVLLAAIGMATVVSWLR